jgi:hypothetical protein
MDGIPKDITVAVRVRSLLGELTALTGASEAEVVMIALEERAARLKGPVSREERIGQVLTAIGPLSRPGRAAVAPDRSEHDRALGYGKEGV